MYTILWYCYDDVWVFYDERKIYTSIEQAQAIFDEVIHTPKYAGEVFKIAKVVII